LLECDAKKLMVEDWPMAMVDTDEAHFHLNEEEKLES
jgi:hypothetical protein